METNTQTIVEQNEDMSLREVILGAGAWIKYLFSKWYFIVAFALLGALLGYLYASSQKPVYSAVTTFVLESGDGGGLSQYAGVASMIGLDIGGGGGGLFKGDNILELYKSRKMIERTLLSQAEFNGKPQLMIHRFLDFAKLRQQWKNKPALRNIEFNQSGMYSSKNDQVLHDSVMSVVVKDILKNYLSVAKPDRKLSIVKVEVKAKDELFAKSFNEKIVQNVNDFYVQTRTRKSMDNVVLLQRKADSVRGAMTGAVYRAAQVADATPNLNPTRQTQRIAPIQNATMSAEINKAILPELLSNLELSKMALYKETPLIQVVDEPILPLESTKLGRLKTSILGGLLGFVVIVLFFITRRFLKSVLKEEPKYVQTVSA